MFSVCRVVKGVNKILPDVSLSDLILYFLTGSHESASFHPGYGLLQKPNL